ncbi:MAG: thiamine phosphate synthase, partial [Oscillospiraceae bacterium]|nr:thiamine phosphate synthase [Oscillospiraceae bacterium]
MNCDKNDLLLYAVTDRAWLGNKTLVQQVEESLQGGATMIQLREKHLDRAAFKAEALELKELCRTYAVPLIINDDVELALEIGADGVHVGQEDLEAGRARALLGPDKLLGV